MSNDNQKQKLAVVLLFLAMAAIFISQIYYPKEAPSSELAFVPYVLFMIAFFFLKIDGRWFIIGAIIMLVVAAGAMIEKSEANAELAAIHAYYFLCAGVFTLLAEMIVKRKDEELYFVKWSDFQVLVSQKERYEWKGLGRSTQLGKRASQSSALQLLNNLRNSILDAIEPLAGWFWELTIFSGVLLVALGWVVLKKLDEPMYFIDIEKNIILLLLPSLALAILSGYLRYRDSLKAHPQYNLIKNMTFFSFASLVGNFFSFIYHFYTARLLTAVEYGTLNALIAAFSLLLIPVGSFSSLIIKRIAEAVGDISKISSLARASLKLILIFTIGVSVLVLVFKDQLEAFFHVSDPLVMPVFVLIIILSGLGTIVGAVLQGLQKFFASGLISVIGSIGKLALAFLFIGALGLGLAGALGAFGAAALITIVLGMGIIYKFIINKAALPFNAGIIKTEYLTIAAIDIGFFLALNGDLILLGNRFPEASLGFYSAASVIAKIITYATLPLVSVAFPKIVEQSKLGKNPSAFFVSLGLVLVGGLIFLAAYSFVGEHIISFLYSSKYAAAKDFLFLLSLSALFYCLNVTISRYFIATENREYALLALLIPIIGLGVFYFSADIYSAPIFMLEINILIFLIGVFFYVVTEKPKNQITKVYKDQYS